MQSAVLPRLNSHASNMPATMSHLSHSTYLSIQLPKCLTFASPLLVPTWYHPHSFTYCINTVVPHTAQAKPIRRSSVLQRLRASERSQDQVVFVEIGCGADLHGQDATVASVRACNNAMQFNSLPGLSRLLPDGDFAQMKLHVRLGVPKPYGQSVDIERVIDQFPYGKVVVEVVDGGLCCSSGVELPEHGDAEGDDSAIVVVAAVEVIC